MKRKIRKGLVVIMIVIAALMLGITAAELLITQFQEFIAFILCLLFLASFGVANAG